MTVRPTTPARAARRQLLRDRFAEYLTEHGAHPEHAPDYARDLAAIVDDLGFVLPAGIDDAPPPSYSTRAGRDAAKELFASMRRSAQTSTDTPPPA